MPLEVSGLLSSIYKLIANSNYMTRQGRLVRTLYLKFMFHFVSTYNITFHAM